jgi:hypothetical protein
MNLRLYHRAKSLIPWLGTVLATDTAGIPEVLAVASTVAANGIRTCFLAGLDIGAVPADAASGFTTDGAGVTISAPGEEWTDIVSLPVLGCQGLQSLHDAWDRWLYSQVSAQPVEARGTSFSAALVSGVVARVLQKLLVPLDSGATTVEGVRNWLQTNASRVGVAPLDNPLAPAFYPYTFDGVREGIARICRVFSVCCLRLATAAADRQSWSIARAAR